MLQILKFTYSSYLNLFINPHFFHCKWFQKSLPFFMKNCLSIWPKLFCTKTNFHPIKS